MKSKISDFLQEHMPYVILGITTLIQLILVVLIVISKGYSCSCVC